MQEHTSPKYGIFRTDVDGLCFWVNDAFCKITGYSQEQLQSQFWFQILAPLDRSKVVREWDDATESNLPFNLECRLSVPNHNNLLVTIEATPVNEENSDSIFWMVVVTPKEPIRFVTSDLQAIPTGSAKIPRDQIDSDQLLNKIGLLEGKLEKAKLENSEYQTKLQTLKNNLMESDARSESLLKEKEITLTKLEILENQTTILEEQVTSQQKQLANFKTQQEKESTLLEQLKLAETAKNKLLQEAVNLQDKIDLLESTIKEQYQNIKSLQSQIELLQKDKKIEGIEKISAQQEELRLLKQEVEEGESQKHLLTQKLEQKEKIISELRANLTAQNESIYSELTNEHAHLSEQVKFLSQEISRLKSDNANLEQELSNSKAEIIHLNKEREREINTIHQEVASSINESNQELALCNQELQRQIDILSEKLNEKDSNIEALKSGSEVLTQQVERLGGFEDALTFVNKEVSELKTQLAEKDQTIADLQNNHATEAAMLKVEIEDQTQTIEQFESTIQKLQEFQSSHSHLEEKLQSSHKTEMELKKMLNEKELLIAEKTEQWQKATATIEQKLLQKDHEIELLNEKYRQAIIEQKQNFREIEDSLQKKLQSCEDSLELANTECKQTYNSFQIALDEKQILINKIDELKQHVRLNSDDSKLKRQFNLFTDIFKRIASITDGLLEQSKSPADQFSEEKADLIYKDLLRIKNSTRELSLYANILSNNDEPREQIFQLEKALSSTVGLIEFEASQRNLDFKTILPNLHAVKLSGDIETLNQLISFLANFLITNFQIGQQLGLYSQIEQLDNKEAKILFAFFSDISQIEQFYSTVKNPISLEQTSEFDSPMSSLYFSGLLAHKLHSQIFRSLVSDGSVILSFSARFKLAGNENIELTPISNCSNEVATITETISADLTSPQFTILPDTPNESERLDLPSMEEFNFTAEDIVVEEDSPEVATNTPLILIAEANKINQKRLTDILDQCEYQYHVVKNGVEVLEHVQNYVYHLLLLDFHLPILNAMDTADQVRMISEHYKNVPIYTMTNQVSKDFQAAIVKSELDNFLVKPIRVQELTELLEKITLPPTV